MEKHVKAAVDRYPETERSHRIHPVAEIDAQIIVEVIELFKKLKLTDAVTTLKKWKSVADDDIALDLLDINTKLGSIKGKEAVADADDEPPALLSRYLLVCGRRIDMFLIIGYDSIDFTKDDGITLQYCIQMNPTPANSIKVPFYANEVLIFDTEVKRDEVLMQMDTFMIENKGLFL